MYGTVIVCMNGDRFVVHNSTYLYLRRYYIFTYINIGGLCCLLIYMNLTTAHLAWSLQLTYLYVGIVST
jgi:hypothetical protein